MRNIKLKLTKDADLEDKLPSDRVITIDDNNVVYLYDTMFIIDEKDIQEVLND